MAEYVDRTAVAQAMIEQYELVSPDDIRETVARVPAADVRENVHGKWIDDGFLGRKTCFICGKWIANNTGTAELNYCPNCGADMRGGKND